MLRAPSGTVVCARTNRRRSRIRAVSKRPSRLSIRPRTQNWAHGSTYTGRGAKRNPAPRGVGPRRRYPLSWLISGSRGPASVVGSPRSGFGDYRDCARPRSPWARNSPSASFRTVVVTVASVCLAWPGKSYLQLSVSRRNRANAAPSLFGPPGKPRRDSAAPHALARAARDSPGTGTRAGFNNVISAQSAAGERPPRRSERAVSSCVVREA
jgi:hypothetical protein